MEKQSECIKVKDRDGKVLLSIYPGKEVHIEQRSGNGSEPPKTGGNKNGGKGGNGNGNGHSESMTFPQKKFLFRLLAGQGIEGDAAQARSRNSSRSRT